jgi:hypothetical protein
MLIAMGSYYVLAEAGFRMILGSLLLTALSRGISLSGDTEYSVGVALRPRNFQ